MRSGVRLGGDLRLPHHHHHSYTPLKHTRHCYTHPLLLANILTATDPHNDTFLLCFTVRLLNTFHQHLYHYFPTFHRISNNITNFTITVYSPHHFLILIPLHMQSSPYHKYHFVMDNAPRKKS